jgi:predicted AAA+ superfamily ATPase
MNYKPRLIEQRIKEYFEVFSVVSIIGPRQCGKSTLLEHYSQKDRSKWQYFNLDLRTTRAKVESDPDLFIRDFDSNVIIDEAQKVPDLFHAIKSLVDKKFPYKILLSGSINFLMLESVSESMSGRIGILEMLPFSLSEKLEVKSNNLVNLLIEPQDANLLFKKLHKLKTIEEKKSLILFFKVVSHKFMNLSQPELLTSGFKII